MWAYALYTLCGCVGGNVCSGVCMWRILVTSDSGLYVQGTLSESDLGKVKVGSMISGYSYESYTSFTAEITEISKISDHFPELLVQ